MGLVGSSPASNHVKKIISSELGFEKDGDTAKSIKVSTKCRFSPVAVCHKGDVVLLKDGSSASFKAGKIHLHVEVHGLPFSMISVLAIHKHEPHSGYPVWTFLQQNIFIEADQILETLVYSELPDGKIAALLPLEFRSPC